MKLQNKISLTIFGLIIFFGTLATITTFYLTRNAFTKQLTNNIVSNSLSQNQEVYQTLSQSREISKMLSERPAVREYFTNPSNLTIKQQIENKYLDGFNLGKMYSAVYLLDKDGVGKVSTDPRFIGQDYSFREYFKASKQGSPAFIVAKGVTSQELGYYFSSPIYSTKNDGEVIGVAVVKLIPSFIETALIEHSNAGLSILLADQNGIVIVSSDSDKLFHSLGIIRNTELENLVKNNSYGLTNIKPLDYDVLMDYLQGTDKTPRSYEIMDKEDNEEEVVAITKVKDFPLYLIFEGSLDEITQLSLRSSSVIAAFVAAAALASIVVIMLILRMLLHQQQENEQKIQERTLELEKLNSLMIGRELKMIELKDKINELQDKK